MVCKGCVLSITSASRESAAGLFAFELFLSANVPDKQRRRPRPKSIVVLQVLQSLFGKSNLSTEPLIWITVP